jgi:hypothetical protein
MSPRTVPQAKLQKIIEQQNKEYEAQRKQKLKDKKSKTLNSNIEQHNPIDDIETNTLEQQTNINTITNQHTGKKYKLHHYINTETK